MKGAKAVSCHCHVRLSVSVLFAAYPRQAMKQAAQRAKQQLEGGGGGEVSGSHSPASKGPACYSTQHNEAAARSRHTCSATCSVSLFTAFGRR